MKKGLKYIFTLTFLMCLISFGFSQTPNKDKVDALKADFIKKKLNLTDQESKAFWPLYNEMNDKLEAARKTFRQQYNAKTNYNFATDKEAEAYVNAELTLKQKESTIYNEYLEKIKKVLPIKKVALWRRAEEEFKQELIKIAKGPN